MHCEAVPGIEPKCTIWRRVRYTTETYVYIYSILTGTRINSDVVDLLCEALHSTKARDTITASALGNVLAALENEDGRFCCDLDIKSFCAVLNVVLWAEDCREGERILVILSVSTIFEGLVISLE